MGYSEVPSAAILVVLLAVLLSVVFAAGIGITSLVLRNNKLVINLQYRLLSLQYISGQELNKIPSHKIRPNLAWKWEATCTHVAGLVIMHPLILVILVESH